MEISPDEYMVVCMSRQIKDGDLVAQGLATPLVAAAYLLARQTHAPNLYFASAIGQSVCSQPAPLSLLWVEKLWLDRALANVGFVRAVADLLPCMRPKEFFRPAQIDPYGNFNNIAFGKNYQHPRLRLPGTGGIPDVTTYISDIYIYVPRHSRLTFVSHLDYLSGLGHHPSRTHGAGPPYLVTDLGQFDFVATDNREKLQQKRMRLTSYHPGVKIEKIKAKTGFEFEVAPGIQETEIPTDDEIKLLRQEIDPLGIRKLEFMSGAERRAKLRQIFTKEKSVFESRN